MTAVLFQMWAPFRESLIKANQFYFEQASHRLLSQFENIEQEADLASAEWETRHAAKYDPERDDPGSFAERAHEAGVQFYGLLSDMRDQTILSIAAGMFHEWEKQQRDWLAREVQHWQPGEHLRLAIWAADFPKIMDLFECIGLEVRAKPYFKYLDACRLVVNAYKHGNGKSLEDLKKKHPEYLEDPLAGLLNGTASLEYLDHTNLKVSKVQLEEFSNAMECFWRDIPESVQHRGITNLPNWFEKALLKNRRQLEAQNE